MLAHPDVPARDKLWLVLREEWVGAPILREFSSQCADLALALIDNPNPHSLEAIEVKRRWLRGEATGDELAVAARAARRAATSAARGVVRGKVRPSAWAVAEVVAFVSADNVIAAAVWGAKTAGYVAGETVENATWGDWDAGDIVSDVASIAKVEAWNAAANEQIALLKALLWQAFQEEININEQH